MVITKYKRLLGFAICLFALTGAELKASDSLQMKEQFIILLKDKANTPYSVDRPEEFLSQRAIERKKRLGIEINEEDFPVNTEYKNEIAKFSGVHVLYSSRWFNTLTIELDTLITKVDDLLKISFVSDVKHIGRTPVSKQRDTSLNSMKEEIFKEKIDNLRLSYNTDKDFTIGEYYGQGFEQIQMLSGHIVHLNGYTGKDVLIAVLDVGFQNVNKLPVFDSLFVNNRIVDYSDFVDFDGSVWEDGSHGTNVLSCIAANIPGIFVGTAPDADFVLVRTENDGYESRIEESNWLQGAEYADSIGADLISSSLGYTTFTDKEFSHTYFEMDGKTTLITRAADKAFEKGIIVLNSAGNEGYSSWRYIGAPADGVNVVASGGVDVYLYPSTFSSFGPSYDKRVKPNISAMATNTIVAETDGEIGESNGTSFSNPVLAGMFACLIQANPHKTLNEILDAVYQSSTHYTDPNEAYGYGVPNFEMALAILGTLNGFETNQNRVFETELNKGMSILTLRMYSAYNQKVTFSILKQSSSGKFKSLKKFKVKMEPGQFYSTPFLINYILKNRLKQGSYIIQIESKYLLYQRSLSVG